MFVHSIRRYLITFLWWNKKNWIMSNFINRAFILFSINLNQSITVWVLRHWLHFLWLVIALLIFSRSTLENIPLSLFAELINQHGNLVLKFSLLSFNLTYADWSACCSILFLSFSFFQNILLFFGFLFSGCCPFLLRFGNIIIYKFGIFLFQHFVYIRYFVGK